MIRVLFIQFSIIGIPEPLVFACGIDEDESCGWVAPEEETPEPTRDFLVCPECESRVVTARIDANQPLTQLEEEELQRMVREEQES